jgi:hypothetical protein
MFLIIKINIIMKGKMRLYLIKFNLFQLKHILK